MTQRELEDWTGRTVAVTGAAGFLGSHLVEVLLAAGATVRAFARYNSAGNIGLLRHVRQHERLTVHFGDVRSAATLDAAIDGADAVYHLAALVSVPHSYADPGGYEQNNVLGTVNLLNACRAHGVGRVVAVSSSEVYGTAQRELIDEDHPLVAQSPYAATKIAAEKICESYYRSYDTPVVVARPFNLYGPRQSRRAVIPEVVAQALAGDVVRIGTVASYRDFNYVVDTATALLRLGLAVEVEGRVFNIGSGQAVQIGEIVTMVGELLGRSLTVETDPSRLRPGASEVMRLCADSSALRKVIGDWPQTPMEIGLTRVIAEMRTRDNAGSSALR
jgi:nucleoside-diphosphate-sugar epimerase